MEWFPFNIAQWDADTAHLSVVEDGAYFRLIRHYMRTRAPLLDNDKALANIVGLGSQGWNEISKTIRGFFHSRCGRLHQKHCDEVISDQNSRKSKKSRTESSTARHGKAKRPKRKSDSADLLHRTGQDRTGQEDTYKGASRDAPNVYHLPISKKISDLPDPERAVARWNEFAGANGLAPVERLLPERRRALVRRISESGGIDGFDVVFEKIAAAPYLLGSGDRGWKICFDFLLHQRKFTKIMEGGYESRHHSNADTKAAGDERVARDRAEILATVGARAGR